MAQAEKVSVTAYVLSLSEEEAQTLMDIGWTKVTGSMSSRRKHMSAITLALRDAGVTDSGGADMTRDSGIHFHLGSWNDTGAE